MKKVLLKFLDPTRATLLIALVVGLGIAVHEVFFLVAFAIAIIALAQSVFHAIGEHISWSNSRKYSVKLSSISYRAK
jgi:hypothetical protein